MQNRMRKQANNQTNEKQKQNLAGCGEPEEK